MDITVDHADLVVVGPGHRNWLLGLIVEDEGVSRRILHVLPEETVENMMVEFDLDPDDVDGAIELALYLPWVDDPITHDHPKSPHRVDDPVEARRHIVEQVARRRGTGRLRGLEGRSTVGAAGPQMAAMVVADSGEEDPLAVLRRELPVSREHIAVKREAHEESRRRARRARQDRPGRLRRLAGAGRESAEQMRARLVKSGALAPTRARTRD